MLYITRLLHNREVDFKTGLEWHVGEPMPIINMRDVVFHADGDELDLVLHAMRHTRIYEEPVECAHAPGATCGLCDPL